MAQILVLLALYLVGSLADPCYRKYNYDETVDAREFEGHWTNSHANVDHGSCPRSAFKFERNNEKFKLDISMKENNTFLILSGTGQLKNGFFRIHVPKLSGNYKNFVVLDHDEGFKEYFVLMNCYIEDGKTIQRTKVFIRKDVNAGDVYEKIKHYETDLNVTYKAIRISDADCSGNPIPA